MKQTDVCVHERHAVLPARVLHCLVAHRPAWLSDERDAVLARVVDVVAKRNEPVAHKRYAIELSDPLPAFVVAQGGERCVERLAQRLLFETREVAFNVSDAPI
jgi:hypothetical protein